MMLELDIDEVGSFSPDVQLIRNTPAGVFLYQPGVLRHPPCISTWSRPYLHPSYKKDVPYFGVTDSYTVISGWPLNVPLADGREASLLIVSIHHFSNRRTRSFEPRCGVMT
jgi:hypothetical protein